MRSILAASSLLFAILLHNPCLCQDSWDLEMVGEAMYDGRLANYYTHNNCLYIATSRSNPQRGLFTVVDILEPGHPHRISTVYEDNSIRDFLVIDSLLYMATSGGGVVIYNVQEPSSPMEIVRFEENRGFGIMKRYNNYIASSYASINIIDIQNPFNPEVVCEISTSYPTSICDFDFYGNYLLLTEANYPPFYGSYLEVYDISDFSNPIQVYSACLDSTFNFFFQLKVIDNYFYLYGSVNGIQIYDITDPSEPQLVDVTFEECFIKDIEIHNNHLFAGTFDNHLLTIDVSEPAIPVITNEYPTQSYPRNLRVSEDNLYFSTNAGDITFLDISNPDSPILDGRYIPGTNTWGVTKWENYVYLAASYGGFRVVDVSDPSDPVGVNYFYSSEQTHNVFIDEGLLFIADNYAGVLIFSLDDPLNPEYLSSVFTASNVSDMYASGNLLYIVNSDGFRIVDISDPANPIIVAHYPSDNHNNFYMSIIARDNYVYTAERYEGVCVYDITDPSNPALVTCYDEANYPHDFYIRDNILYVADWGNGLLTLDISNPSNPVFMGLGACNEAFGIWVDGNIAYVADRESGIKAYDITNPYSVQLVGFYDDEDYCNEVYAKNDTVYVAACSGGLWILHYDESLGIENIPSMPEKFILSQNYPNPFNAVTTIKYTLPKESDVIINIYNLLGRKIETLIDVNQPAGIHSLVWDAEEFSSGMYFYKIEAGEFVQTKRMLLLK